MQCHSSHHHFIMADTCRTPQGMLNTLKSKQQHLVEQHEKSKTLTRSSEVREIKDDIQKEVDEVLQLMQLVKVRLDALDKSNADAMKRKVGTQPASHRQLLPRSSTRTISKNWLTRGSSQGHSLGVTLANRLCMASSWPCTRVNLPISSPPSTCHLVRWNQAAILVVCSRRAASLLQLACMWSARVSQPDSKPLCRAQSRALLRSAHAQQ